VYQYTTENTLFWDWQCEVRAVYRPHPDHVLTFGGDTLLSEGRFDPACLTVDGSTLADAVTIRHDLHDAGAYLQEEWTCGKWVVVPGARFDHNSATDWTTSPKLGVLYNATDSLRLRSSAGLAFRAPTLSELYAPDTPESGTVLKSNASLKPQYLDAYDFGCEKDLRKGLTLGVDVFANFMRDLINLASSGFTRTYVNIDRAVSDGFDSTLVWKPCSDWKLSLNHTYQWAIDSETKTQLDYMPQNKGNVTVVYSRLLGKWRLEGNFQEFISGTRYYTDYDPTAPRFLLPGYADTSLGVKVSWRENAYVETKITNLFNASYEETGNYLTPGRMIQVGSGIRF
jgi:outer membrane cobalamin receptor